jgi:hypothetical protein
MHQGQTETTREESEWELEGKRRIKESKVRINLLATWR